MPWFKPFKHAYQKELRVVCAPPAPSWNLEPVEIEIGPLSDCAIYVDKQSHPSRVLPPDPHDEPVRSFGSAKYPLPMNNEMPRAAKIQGILLYRSGDREEWEFELQYTDDKEVWHQLRFPVNQGLHLLNLLQTADKEQALSLFGEKNKSW